MEGQCQINMDTLNQKPHKTTLDNLFEFEIINSADNNLKENSSESIIVA